MNLPGRKLKQLLKQVEHLLQVPMGYPLMLKNLSQVLRIIWKLLKKVIWRSGKQVEQWKYSEGIWIPKEHPQQEINIVCFFYKITIILIHRYKKELFQVFQDVWSTQESSCCYWMKQRQARFILAVLWLDLKDAYRCIPYKPVEETLPCQT